jgi:sulfatase modifying factor 1
MRTRIGFLFVAVLAAFTSTPTLRAQSLVTIDTVTVGDAGNAADTTGYGAVTDVFAIGKYEVTIGQYTTFLNSVASVTSDTYIVDLWNANMATNLNIAGISRSGSGTLASPYSYSVIGSGNRPIAYVSWFDAARFANWINNGATNGASTETGAYTLNGATSGIITKNVEATWWIPSEDEWYKAAYYRGGGTNSGYWLYPTQSDTAPGNVIGASANQANHNSDVWSVTQLPTYDPNQNYLTDVGAFAGSPSAYGTFDQGGNLAEWNDAIIELGARNYRGGDWSELSDALKSSYDGWSPLPTEEVYWNGFRVATIPEPSAYALLLMTGAGGLWWARRKR